MCREHCQYRHLQKAERTFSNTSEHFYETEPIPKIFYFWIPFTYNLIFYSTFLRFRICQYRKAYLNLYYNPKKKKLFCLLWRPWSSSSSVWKRNSFEDFCGLRYIYRGGNPSSDSAYMYSGRWFGIIEREKNASRRVCVFFFFHPSSQRVLARIKISIKHVTAPQ